MLEQIAGYEIIAEIGQGAMATVYRARAVTPRDGAPRELALKVLRPQYLSDLGFRARFEREGALIETLSHTAIVPVYDVGQAGGQLYMAMAYMPHGSLAERLLHAQPSLEEAMAILARVGVALDYAHGQGVIHRDLKPSNVLFNARDEAFLADFGIAYDMREDSRGVETISGTPAYMSPEQARGEKTIGAASDVYTLGVLAFELLAGRLPFRAETPVAVLLQQMQEAPPRPSQVNPSLPPGVDAVLLKALAKDAGQRYASATAFISALRLALEGRLVAVEPMPVTAPVDGGADGPAPEGERESGGQPATAYGVRERAAAARLWLEETSPRLRAALANWKGTLAGRPALAFSLVTMLAVMLACVAVGALRGSALMEAGRGSEARGAPGVSTAGRESLYLPLASFTEERFVPTATPAPTSEPPAAVNVRLLVDGDSVTLLNISGEAVALGALTVRRVNGDGQALGTFELRQLRRVAGNALNALPPDDCLQIWRTDALRRRGPQKPAACDTLQGWLATRDTDPLFEGAQEGDAFEVLRGDRRLVFCVLTEGSCAFLAAQE